MKGLLTILLVLVVASLKAQVETDVLTKTLQFEKDNPANVLYVTNINGSIDVEGYNGSEIQIEVKRTIKAKSADRLERGKDEINIGVMDRMDTLVVYMTNGCGNFTWDKNKRENGPNWDYNWRNCNPPYDFVFDIKIRVPKGNNIYLSTVNQGDVNVSGMQGTMELRNVNGSISALGIHKSTMAHTVNGDIRLEYDKVPESGSFYSLNGDINAWFPKGLKATVTFKSFNGDIFTNIDDYQQEPILTKTASSKKGVSFKAESKSAITFRGGGIPMDFETFNGNVYIKENE